MNSDPEHPANSAYLELSEKLIALETRVALLESSRTSQSISFDNSEVENSLANLKLKGTGKLHLESKIGEYGLAWLGNIVLFFGIIFFMQYINGIGYRLIASVFGFVSATGVFILARYFRNNNSYMAKIFNLNAYVLLNLVVLKLHFFTSDPLISDKTVGLVLLLIVSGVMMFLSYRNKNAVLAGMTLIQMSAAAIVSDSTHIMLPLATVISAITVLLLYRFGWIRIVYLSIFLVYLNNFLWMIGNPVMGHQLKAISDPDSGFVYLFLIAAVYSLMALMPEKKEQYTDNGIIGLIIFNGIGFSFLITLYVLTFFKDNYVLLTGSISLYCFVYSIILKFRSNLKITPAFYALFSFVTLSVSFYGIYKLPDAYFFLAFQSLLVVSIAIWYRSKFIILINSILFAIMLIVYLSTSLHTTGVNISFSFVALATARILNWKKERLTITTEYLRNFYLISAFFMVLYTLYNLAPKQYITLSWTLMAVLYFVLSLILKNVKYRYLALGTMIAAAIYLFIVDLARIELVYRIIALLFLSIISIGLSVFYTRKLKRKAE